MVVSEVMGLFLMPFGITMNNAAYGLFNELGILFIPFILSLIGIVVKARSQGADEGSPAINTIKLVEKDWIKKFVVLYLLVIPIGGTATYTFNEYSHSSVPSFISGAESVSSLKPSVNSKGFSGQVPPLLGLINNASVALAQSLIAKIPCTLASGSNSKCQQDATFANLIETLSNLNTIEDLPLVAEINDFNKQCYSVALNQYFHAKKLDSDSAYLNENYPNNSAQRYSFNSTLLMKAYQGNYQIDGYTNLDPLYINITLMSSMYWNKNVSSGSYKCYDVADYVYDDILDYINEHNGTYNSKMMTAWIAYMSQYSGSNGSGSGNAKEVPATNAEAKNEFVYAAFINTINSAGSIGQAASEKVSNVLDKEESFFFNKKGDGHHASMAGNSVREVYNGVFVKNMNDQTTFWGSFKQAVVNTVNLGNATVGGIGAYENYQKYIRLTPVICEIMLSGLIMFAPLILVLSGYNGKIAYRFLVTYFGIAFTPYIYELGIMVGDAINAAAGDSDFRTFQPGHILDGTAKMYTWWLTLLLPIGLAGIWNILIQFIAGSAMKKIAQTSSSTYSNEAHPLQKLQVLKEALLNTVSKQLLTDSDGYTKQEKAAIERGMEEGFKSSISKLTPQDRQTIISKFRRH